MIKIVSPPLLLAGALLCLATVAHGRAVSVPAGREGEQVSPEYAERHGWPKGTLNLINHPLRHFGWKFIFNTEPADRTSYAFIPRNPKELQTIISTSDTCSSAHPPFGESFLSIIA